MLRLIKKAMDYMVYSNTMRAFNEYCHCVITKSIFSPGIEQALTNALNDPHFDWNSKMPSGIFFEGTAKIALFKLILKKHVPAVNALSQLHNANQINLNSHSQGDTGSELAWMICIARYNSTARVILFNLIENEIVDLNTQINGLYLNEKKHPTVWSNSASVFLLIMNLIRYGIKLTPEFYEYCLQRNDVNWNEQCGYKNQDPEETVFPQTPHFWSIFAAGSGDTSALAVLDRLIAIEGADWIQCSDERKIEIQNYHMMNECVIKDSASQTQKNEYRILAKLIDIAIKYPEHHDKLYQVLALNSKNDAFLVHCKKVFSGLKNDELSSLFLSTLKRAEDLWADCQQLNNDLFSITVQSLEVIAYSANVEDGVNYLMFRFFQMTNFTEYAKKWADKAHVSKSEGANVVWEYTNQLITNAGAPLHYTPENKAIGQAYNRNRRNMLWQAFESAMNLTDPQDDYAKRIRILIAIAFILNKRAQGNLFAVTDIEKNKSYEFFGTIHRGNTIPEHAKRMLDDQRSISQMIKKHTKTLLAKQQEIDGLVAQITTLAV